MSEFDFVEMVARANEVFKRLSPLQQALEMSKQRRSFVRSQFVGDNPDMSVAEIDLIIDKAIGPDLATLVKEAITTETQRCIRHMRSVVSKSMSECEKLHYDYDTGCNECALDNNGHDCICDMKNDIIEEIIKSLSHTV